MKNQCKFNILMELILQQRCIYLKFFPQKKEAVLPFTKIVAK